MKLIKKVDNFFEKKKVVVIILACLMLFHLSTNVFYLYKDNTPTTWDESWHTFLSFDHYYRISGEREINPEVNFPLTYWYVDIYPNLIQFIPVPFYFFLGPSEDVAAFSMILFFILLIFFTYLIGSEFFNEKVGLFSAILVSFYPIVFGMSRIFLLDLAVASFVAGTFYFILRYEKEKKNIFLIWILIFFILGGFTKQTYFVFVLFPLFFVLINNNKEFLLKSLKKKKIIFGLIGIIALGILFSYFYLVSFSGRYVIGQVFRNASFSTFFSSLPIIFNFMKNIQMGPIGFFLFCFGLIFVWRLNYKFYFLSWIFVSLGFFAYTGFLSEGRYTIAILPAVAIISVVSLFSLKRKEVSYFVFIFIFVLMFMGYYNISFGQGFVQSWGVFMNAPSSQDWMIENILSDINSTVPSSRIFVASNVAYFNVHNFAVKAYKEKYNLTIGYYFRNPEVPEFIILKSGYNSVDKDFSEVYYYVVNNELNLFAIYPLPDGSVAGVYRNNENRKIY